MFSGIVEGVGRVVSATSASTGASLTIDLAKLVAGIALGDSVAIHGVCLTAARINKTEITFDVIPETLKKTTLGLLAAGDSVNIERSLKIGDSLDGHFVQGHVQGVGEITEKIVSDAEYVLWITPPTEIMQYVVSLGSIAVNGVSLTVAQLREDAFAVALIPTTLKLTTLGALQKRDQVNIETDMIARQVVRYLQLQHNV